MARVAAGAAALLVLLAGCGSATTEPAAGDQPVTAAATATATSSATPSPEASSGGSAAAAFCTAVTAVDTATATAPSGSDVAAAARAEYAAKVQPLLDAMKSAAPEALTADVATFTELAKKGASGEEAALDSTDYAQADSAVDAYLLSSCGYPEIPAYAVDYEFDRLPDSVPAGPTAVSLTNDGQELHHLVLLRVDAGVTESVDDLVELSAADLVAKTERVAVVLVKPGRTNTSLVDLEPGRYAVVCFIPKGSKGGATGDGVPHHADGMLTELTVT